MKVVGCLNDISGQIILWPRGQELDSVKADFNKNSLLRGIIGAIDGTHILIKAPKVCNYVIVCCVKKYDIVVNRKELRSRRRNKAYISSFHSRLIPNTIKPIKKHML